MDEQSTHGLPTCTDWEDVPCGLCGSPSAGAHVVARFEQGAYRRCDRCQFVYLSPRLSEQSMLGLYQAGRYFSGERSMGYESYIEDEPAYRRTFARRLGEFSAFKPGGSLLDVGCGYGWLVDAALERGYDAFGLEASEEAVAARGDLGDRIRRGVLGGEEFGTQRFDVISMMDVFEHLYEPTRQLENLADHLRPDGILAIATPDFDSWLRKTLGRRSISFKVPEHVAYYTRDTLERVAAPQFTLIHTQPIGQYCTLAFLERRFAALFEPMAWPIRLADRLLGDRWMPYVPSGSMLAILKLR